MKILNLIQGTPEWHAHRAKHRNASDAAAMMGASKYKSRNDLLKEMATGVTLEFDLATLQQFGDGHRTEAAIRTHIEATLGDELFPCTGVSDKYPLLSASFDGLTMDEGVGFEHKLWNKSVVDLVVAGRIKDEPMYYWQLEQQLLVSGASFIRFVTSNGTPEFCEYVDYYPVAGRAEQLVAGWAQFEIDLKNYTYVEPVQEAVGAAPETLPALRIELTGMVTATNLPAYKEKALAVFASINKNLVTDNDFADAEKTVKWCATIEDSIKAAKQHALSQTSSIDELMRTLDSVSEAARTVRLDLDKLVKVKKESRRVEILQKAKSALNVHAMDLQRFCDPVRLIEIRDNFAEVIKGKKTLTSIQDAVDTELARCKIEANKFSDLVRGNLLVLGELAKNHSFLFNDIQQLAYKASDDFINTVKMRISDHEAKERARIDEEVERKLQAERDAAAERAAKDLERQKEMVLAASKMPDLPPDRVREIMRGFSHPAAESVSVPVVGVSAATEEMGKKKPERPSEGQIVAALATIFDVDEKTVVEWLFDLDLTKIDEVAA